MKQQINKILYSTETLVTAEDLRNMADIVESTEKNTGRRCFVIADDGVFSLLTQRDETPEETFEREARENERKAEYTEFENSLIGEILKLNPGVEYDPKPRRVAWIPQSNYNTVEFRNALSWSMTRPLGVFMRDGKIVPDSELKIPNISISVTAR